MRARGRDFKYGRWCRQQNQIRSVIEQADELGHFSLANFGVLASLGHANVGRID